MSGMREKAVVKARRTIVALRLLRQLRRVHEPLTLGKSAIVRHRESGRGVVSEWPGARLLRNGNVRTGRAREDS